MQHEKSGVATPWNQHQEIALSLRRNRLTPRNRFALPKHLGSAGRNPAPRRKDRIFFLPWHDWEPSPRQLRNWDSTEAPARSGPMPPGSGASASIRRLTRASSTRSGSDREHRGGGERTRNEYQHREHMGRPDQTGGQERTDDPNREPQTRATLRRLVTRSQDPTG